MPATPSPSGARPVTDSDGLGAPRPGPVAAALLGPRAAWWLAAGVLATRAAGFHRAIINVDECDFVLFARMMRAGALPYAGVVDIKPPLTYVVFWAASFFGTSVLPGRVAAALALLATVLLVRAAVRRWTGDAAAGAAAGWCALLASLCELPWAASELFMNLPAAAALYAFGRAERSRALRWDLAAGLAIGAASLFKHQAVLVAPALGGAIAWFGARRREPRAVLRLGLLGAGAAAPWVAALALYAPTGHLADFVDWVFLRNFAYVNGVHASVLPRAGAVLLAVAPCALLHALALGEALRVRRDPVGLGYALALPLTWVAVSMGGRFYQHYFLQLAPVLGVLAGRPLAALASRRGALGAGRRRALAALLALPVAAWAVYGLVRIPLHDYPSQEPRTLEVAAWLREHSAPADRVFVWGDFAPVYYEADRLPGTRYLTVAPHMGNFDPGELPPGFDVTPYRSQRDVDATLADLEANRPRFVVDTAPADIHHWSLVPLAKFPAIEAYVAAHYAEVAAPARARVYARRGE